MRTINHGTTPSCGNDNLQLNKLRSPAPFPKGTGA
jgi:hypothetical protein